MRFGITTVKTFHQINLTILKFAYLVSQPCSAAGLLRFEVWYLAHPSCQSKVFSVGLAGDGCCLLLLNHWKRQRRRVSKEIAWTTKTRPLGNLQLEATEPQGWTFFHKKMLYYMRADRKPAFLGLSLWFVQFCLLKQQRLRGKYNQSSASFSLSNRNLMHICSPITMRKRWHFLACH